MARSFGKILLMNPEFFSKVVFVTLIFKKKMYLFEREAGQRERESPKQAPCPVRTRHGALSHDSEITTRAGAKNWELT